MDAAVGTFAEPVGKKVFNHLVNQACLDIEMGGARSKECSFLLFGVVARKEGRKGFRRRLRGILAQGCARPRC